MSMSSKAVEAAIYHMSRCKIHGFLTPIEFHITEDSDAIGVVAKVTSWPQFTSDPVVTFRSVSRLDAHFLNGDGDEALSPTEMETQSFDKKVFTTHFVLYKRQVMDKSLYEIADLCNTLMKNSVMQLCRGMMDELWEC